MPGLQIPKLRAAIYLSFQSFGLLMILVLLLFDCIKSQSNIAYPQQQRITKRFVALLIVFGTCLQSIRILRGSICHCAWMVSVDQTLMFLCKFLGYGFFIHRAKLAQALTPMLSVKWFETRLPGMVTAFCLFLIVSRFVSDIHDEYVCSSYVDADSIGMCFHKKAPRRMDVWMFIVFDVVFASFLLTLFVVPLYRVHKTDLGALNAAQKASKDKLKRVLIWSVILSFVNMASSTVFIMALGLYPSATTMYLGVFDPAINVWTSWLIPAENREFVEARGSMSRTHMRSVMVSMSMRVSNLSRMMSFRSARESDIRSQGLKNGLGGSDSESVVVKMSLSLE